MWFFWILKEFIYLFFYSVDKLFQKNWDEAGSVLLMYLKIDIGQILF